MINKKELILEGLCCANCASKIESKINQLDGVKDASINFFNKTLTIEISDLKESENIMVQTRGIIKKIEPHVIVREKEIKSENTIRIDEKNTETEKEEFKFKEEILKLTVGLLFFVAALFWKSNWDIILYFISYLIIGKDVLLKASKNILNGQLFDENFLMTLATLGAFGIREFPEAVSVMLFYEIGELLQDLAVDKSRKSITDLLNIKPDYANLKKDNKIIKVSPYDVNIGDEIVVKAGERVPLDGVVIKGQSLIDTSALTGESVPKNIYEGEEILAGFINTGGVLNIRVTKGFKDSSVSKILDMVENASSKKAKSEQFITKFAKIYTPVVVISALLIAFFPPILLQNQNFNDWIYKALIFLVVSCPCALVISIPLSFFGGIGAASRRGILVKGGNYLEGLNEVNTFVFDKTGTLTKGVFKVTKIKAYNGFDEETLLKCGAYGEIFSNHPIAQSIIKEYKGEIDKELIKNYQELPGLGVKVKVELNDLLIGNSKLMDNEKIIYEKYSGMGTVVYVSVDNIFAGYIVVSDEIKEDAKEAISSLKSSGISKVVMLTGDNKHNAEAVGKELNIDEVYAELLPENKVEILEKIKNKMQNGKVAFVGDGINDAPVLAASDIGFAMGALGSDAAIEAADVVLMADELSKISTAIKLGKNTRKIVIQNIVFSIGIKLLVLLGAVFGIATIWEGVFADVGVALIAVLNSLRIIRMKF
ncbi:heavy metal translocating P-type ATPase [Fervidicella metallireducens]|nr:heavy metal translocating P-type ATPase [Fervidicella metallireducens]